MQGGEIHMGIIIVDEDHYELLKELYHAKILSYNEFKIFQKKNILEIPVLCIIEDIRG